MKLWEMTAKEILAHVLARDVSSDQVLDSFLDRISEAEPQLNAFIDVLEPSARLCASRIDKKLEKGENPGLLAGLPVAIKDNICVKGAPCTCASKMLENWIAPYDATCVSKLVEQGAIIIGKTNLDEFAMGSSTETSAFGITKNPWDTERVPGGSSGGSAAAVSSGMAPIALGTDTGGSIRQPASFTGVCGVKPTYGLVSRYGVTAFASSLDAVGPIGETVWDCALVLDAISGFDDMDPTSSARPGRSYRANLDKEVKGLKVGIAQEFLEGVEPDVLECFESKVGCLEDLGIEVQVLTLPSLSYAIDIYYIIASAEASSNLARFDGVRFGRRAEAETLDELYGLSRGTGFGEEVIRRIMIGTYALSAGNKEKYYVRAAKARTMLIEDFKKSFGKVDLIISPATPYVAFKVGEKIEDSLAMYTGDLITVPVNLAGLCALSMPIGFSHAHGKMLPCGLQIIGKPYDEHTVLRLGYALEQAMGDEIRSKRVTMRQSLKPVREVELVD
ncbi:MAG TPA: Asp-tRNA(Asn)/Glu-tRNA(Gln) amidotransferase subunit GatA [Bacillota bacterium]|nr:Asp-tRNA(Asn)/Glu-tRNA(Gln) amidotransferase subunit GatA [Bacillota bacterium]